MVMDRILRPGFSILISTLVFLAAVGTATAAVEDNPGETLTVTVTGSGAAPFKGSEKAARLTALALAKRDAVEKGFGASVNVLMLQDLRKVISQAEGGLSYSILHEGRQGDRFVITIRARVPVPRNLIVSFPLPGEERETQSGFPPLVEEFPDGLINWQEGYLLSYGVGHFPGKEAAGKGTLMARRAAVADAQAKALEMVSGIRVDAEKQIMGFIKENESLSYKVEGTVREAEVIEEKEGDPYRVTLKVPLTGVRGVGLVFYEAVIGERKFDLNVLDRDQTRGSSREFTGLVIDARGTGLAPALFPKVVGRSGRDVYSVEMVDEAAFLKRGVAGYASGDSDMDMSRVGDNPLFVTVTPVSEPMLASLNGSVMMGELLTAESGRLSVKGRRRQGPHALRIKSVGSKGTLKANIVLSDADARKIAGSPEFSSLFKQSRVIIITDSMIGGTEGRDGPRFQPGHVFRDRPGLLEVKWDQR
jgi:hypothetical protein